jgi:hypothetical protein
MPARRRTQSPNPPPATSSPRVDPDSIRLDPLPVKASPTFKKIFHEKIELCRIPCAFEDLAKEEQAITAKLAALVQICQFVSDSPTAISSLAPDEQTALCDMIKSNLFRCYAEVPPAHLLVDVPVFPPVGDKAWIHLRVVYFILFRFQFVCPTHPMFNLDFIEKVIGLFGTPDAEERQEIVQFFRSYLPKHQSQRDFIISKVLFIIRSHIQMSPKPFHVATALPVLFLCFELSANAPGQKETIQRLVLPLIHDPYLDLLQVHVINFVDFYVNDHHEHVVIVVREIFK